MERKEISDFYGGFGAEEMNLRLNIRHYSVFRLLRKAGLQRNHRVLEIGCGFGTITRLIARFVRDGKVTATDISEPRIAFCKQQFAEIKNLEFVLTDMKDFESKEQYDLVVLPDVIEHIPIVDHPGLFGKIAASLVDTGIVFIHVPHPASIDYLKRNNPEKLQIIDQSVHSDELLAAAYSHGLILDSLVSYSLNYKEPDYQYIIFRKNRPYSTLRLADKSRTRWRKLWLRIFYWKSTI